MTQEEIIIAMARESGLHKMIQVKHVVDKVYEIPSEKLERFAALVAEATKAQPQGEWVDLTDDDKVELKQFWNNHKGKSSGLTDSDITSIVCESVIAKFKSKNTPPVVPQGEPVAWMLEQGDVVEFEYRDYHEGSEWTPLYTTPPSVEAMRIETLEKAAKLCEEVVIENGGKTARNKTSFECAAAIRSMK